MNMSIRYRCRRGETLTEVVAAVALVMIAIGSILSILIQSVQVGKDADRAYVAINLCKNRMEQVRRFRGDYGFPIISNMQETNTIVDRNGIADPVGDYMRTTEVIPAYETNLAKITVRVQYKRKGLFSSPEMKLVTLLSSHL